jgi:hypothetical protein
MGVQEFLDFNQIVSNLKEANYQNALAVTALVELLAEKEVITKQDFAVKAREIECADLAEIILKCWPNKKRGV